MQQQRRQEDECHCWRDALLLLLLPSRTVGFVTSCFSWQKRMRGMSQKGAAQMPAGISVGWAGGQSGERELGLKRGEEGMWGTGLACRLGDAVQENEGGGRHWMRIDRQGGVNLIEDLAVWEGGIL
jgi:hypothetical protein